MNTLTIIISLPLVGGLITIILPMEDKKNQENLKVFGLGVSLLTFLISTKLWLGFDTSSAKFQFVEKYSWVPYPSLQGLLGKEIYVSFGVDGISIFFVLLTTLLVPLCLLGSWTINYKVKEYLSAFLIIESFILIVFTALDLLVFYIFFEAVLIPMFLIIGGWGSRERRVRAAYFFFLYTLLGSVLMLLALMIIYLETGSMDYQVLIHQPLIENKQYLLWLAFFASFAVKVPMLPVHIWLPEAHVEAPTAGSVILAGILLKLGSYGLVRFSLPLFPLATQYFTPLVYMISILGVIYTSLTAIRQWDVKRIIAYASVAHINLTLVGLFSLTSQGVEGSILQMLSHGLVSGALFFCVGVLYDRHHSRMVHYYSGLTTTMPIFVTIFLFFTIANIALPGTSSFVGEFLILLGVFQTNTFAAVLSATGIILGGAYSLWVYNRVAYGNIKTNYISYSIDINKREFGVFLPLVILTLVIGLYPKIFLDVIHVSCSNLIEIF